MSVTTVGDFGRLIGARMRAEHESLAGRWLDRLHESLPVAANEVFPSNALLDHIPALIQEIADYLEFTDADEFAANTFVMDKARELGELRYEQRASVHQLLREYRVLAAILVAFVEQETRLLHTVAPIEVIAVLGRVAQAVGVLQQTGHLRCGHGVQPASARSLSTVSGKPGRCLRSAGAVSAGWVA